MNDTTSSPPDESSGTDSKPALIARRTIVAAAAWAPPVIAMSMATPAMAASTNATITLAFANNDDRPVGSSLADAVATVRSKNGVPLPGERVTLQIAGSNPAGGYFSRPGTTSLTGTTNAAGQIAATGLVATVAGTTLGLTATLVGTSTTAYAQIDIIAAPASIELTVLPPSVPTGGDLGSSSAVVKIGGNLAGGEWVRFLVRGPAAFPDGSNSYDTITNSSGIASGLAFATGLTAGSTPGDGTLTATLLRADAADVSDTKPFTVTGSDGGGGGVTPPGTVTEGKLVSTYFDYDGARNGNASGYRDDLSAYYSYAFNGAGQANAIAQATNFASTWRIYTQADGRFYVQNVASGKFMNVRPDSKEVYLGDTYNSLFDLKGSGFVWVDGQRVDGFLQVVNATPVGGGNYLGRAGLENRLAGTFYTLTVR